MYGLTVQVRGKKMNAWAGTATLHGWLTTLGHSLSLLLEVQLIQSTPFSLDGSSLCVTQIFQTHRTVLILHLLGSTSTWQLIGSYLATQAMTSSRMLTSPFWVGVRTPTSRWLSASAKLSTSTMTPRPTLSRGKRSHTGNTGATSRWATLSAVVKFVSPMLFQRQWQVYYYKQHPLPGHGSKWVCTCR